MSETDDQPTIQQLRDRAAQATTLEADNTRIARENAFLKAGINPDDTRLGYFVRGYDGKMDPTEIKDAAIKAGFLPDPEAVTETPATEEAPVVEDGGPSDEEQAQDNLAASVAAGSTAVGDEPPVNLIDEGFSEFHSALQSGSDRRDASAHVIGRAIAQGIGKTE